MENPREAAILLSVHSLLKLFNTSFIKSPILERNHSVCVNSCNLERQPFAALSPHSNNFQSFVRKGCPNKLSTSFYTPGWHFHSASLQATKSINEYQSSLRETNRTKCQGVICDGLTSYPGEVEIPLVAFCYGKRAKRELSCEDFAFLILRVISD